MQNVVMGSLSKFETLSADALNRLTVLEGFFAEDRQTITKLTNVCDITVYNSIANAWQYFIFNLRDR